MTSSYEYYNENQGVQGKFLFEEFNASKNTPNLINEPELQHQIKKEILRRLQAKGIEHRILAKRDSLSQIKKDALIKEFGAPSKKKEYPI